MTNADATGAAAARRVRWWREPLLHFIVLGAALFGLDRAVNGAPDEARTIVVDAAVDAEAVKVFRDARGRAPTGDELYGLRRVWLDNEVLYREGLALQMDKGDKAIRDRVIFKALSMVNAGLQRPPVDDVALKAWFEKNRVKYDEPARLDFQEAALAGDASEATAAAFAAALNAGTPSDEKAGLHVFKARPLPTIVQSYGPEFAQALEALPTGRWQALRQGDGWKVVRLDAVAAARQASFDMLRNVVLQDWTDSVMAEQRSAAVRKLAKKYTVKVEAPTP
ncbi:peptidylprolyl isomerase [Piscinibacter gummiphilus]|uniref:Peptidylprolyl isomerase n=1 Tax=Piscinibacter gummiphilus TaxID=946333 RepID=A0ABZ0CTY4_9BURK|nr:peptidylprolyl isomerase [Piscinibacter gummiphilus]WOB05999.1 peptidylprolyl isomerase [Piscinibacter gummiphilus]